MYQSLRRGRCMDGYVNAYCTGLGASKYLFCTAFSRCTGVSYLECAVYCFYLLTILLRRGWSLCWCLL